MEGWALAVLLAVALAVVLATLGTACCGGDLGVGHGMGRSRSAFAEKALL